MGFARKRPFLIVLFITTLIVTVAYYGKAIKSDALSGAVFSALRRPLSAINTLKSTGSPENKKRTGDGKSVLRPETVVLEELERENRRLRGLLKLADKTTGEWTAATVVGASPSPFSYKILILDKGEKDGVREGMPVTAQIGGAKKINGALVGRILKSHRNNSQVLAITDPASSVDVFIQRTRDRGIVKGRGRDCVMDYIDAEADIEKGDVILSSGRDGVYPRGMIVGTVGKIRSGSGIKKAEVNPAAKPYSFEEVIVLTGAPGAL